MSFESLPSELHYKILSYVKPSAIIREISSVNRQFNECCKSLFLWIEVLKQIPTYEFHDLINLLDYKPNLIPKIGYTIYYLHKRNNFITNPNMDEDVGDVRVGDARVEWIEAVTRGWKYEGDWHIERHVGCDLFPEEAGDVTFNAVTSYREGKRSQVIKLNQVCPWAGELGKEGYALLLHCKVWTAPRFDCASWFKANIFVDGEAHQLLEIEHDAGRKWVKAEMTRVVDIQAEVKYADCGADSRFWAGCYGAKILSPTLTFTLTKA